MKTLSDLQRVLSAVLFYILIFSPGRVTAQASNTCISSLNADFVTKYEVIEGVTYVQTNSAGPVANGTNNYGFDAIIKLATNLDGTASTAVLSFPDGQPILMRQEGLTQFSVALATDAYTNIVSSFPDGTYQFTIFDNTVSVTLPDDTALPNAPTVSAYAADQSIDAGKDFIFSWEPFITGGVIDFISVILISDTNGSAVFKSADFDCPGSLRGGATSIVIPANTMSSNSTYRAQIQFVKVYTFDTNSIPGAALLAGAEAITSATISTGPVTAGGGPAPALMNTALVSGGGGVRFDFSTTPGLSYTVQFNFDLSDSAGWMGLQTVEATGSVLSFTNTQPFVGNAGFYRVVRQ